MCRRFSNEGMNVVMADIEADRLTGAGSRSARRATAEFWPCRPTFPTLPKSSVWRPRRPRHSGRCMSCATTRCSAAQPSHLAERPRRLEVADGGQPVGRRQRPPGFPAGHDGVRRGGPRGQHRVGRRPVPHPWHRPVLRGQARRHRRHRDPRPGPAQGRVEGGCVLAVSRARRE